MRGRMGHACAEQLMPRCSRLLSFVLDACFVQCPAESVHAPLQSFVLLKNDAAAGASHPLLPLRLEGLRRISVIGPMANRTGELGEVRGQPSCGQHSPMPLAWESPHPLTWLIV